MEQSSIVESHICNEIYFFQAAFLSALVGVEVAEAAAQAAVASLSDMDPRKMKEGLGCFANGARMQGTYHFL